MPKEKMTKLGTYKEFTPKGNSYDATDTDLSYNETRLEKQAKDKKKKEEK